MVERHLQITDKSELKNPLNGEPYVYYNPSLDKVWIFLGLKWLLENGYWENNKSWANDGVFNML
jgi:hypothetical protein